MKKALEVLLLFGLTLVSCGTKAPEQEHVNYSVLRIEATDVTLTEKYSASIQGRQDVAVYPQVSGTLHRVCITEGQQIRRGDLLFVIDQVPYQAALQTAVANVHAAETQVETARLTYESKQALYEKEVVSAYDLALSRNALASAQAALEQARAEEMNARNNLSYTEVRSPVDGVAGTLPFRVGALVSPSLSQPLTTVSDNSEMYVYFSMSEQQLQSLVRRYGSIYDALDGMPAVRLQLSDGLLYEEEGRIESISGVLNRETGSGSLRAVFPNKRRMLLSGSTGNILLPTTLRGVVSIPQDATYELQDKQFVYRVMDGRAVATRIEVSPVHDGQTYTVLSGLCAGDSIVTTGVGILKDGDIVLTE